ncbi:hypothetical protein ScPMuIL_001650 [Solemya velum]
MTDNYRMRLYGKENMKLEKDCQRPTPTQGDVQVKVHYVGVCGTDIHMWQHGELGGVDLEFPIVLGHEASGSITCVGDGVTRLSVGDHVALDPIIPCRKCRNCLSGKYNICLEHIVKGCWIDGYLQRFVVMSESNCHVLPNTIPLDIGPLVEPLSVTVRACERGQVAIGDVVVVCGSGTIGLLMMQTVKAAGAKFVCVTDISRERLAMAACLGADHTLDVTNMDPKEVAKQVEHKLGSQADISFECVGKDDSIATAIHATRSGGRAVLVGVPSGLSRVPIDDAVLREIDLITSLAHKDCVPKSISLIEQGKVKVADLITHRYGLNEVETAYRNVRAGAGVKSLICLE